MGLDRSTCTVPDSCAASKRHARIAMTFVSLYYLVGCNQQVARDCEAEPFRGLEIDDQFELPVLPDGKFCRVLAREDAGRIESDQAVALWLPA